MGSLFHLVDVDGDGVINEADFVCRFSPNDSSSGKVDMVAVASLRDLLYDSKQTLNEWLGRLCDSRAHLFLKKDFSLAPSPFLILLFSNSARINSPTDLS